MDYSTWHDQKPTHPAGDPEEWRLRLKVDEAYRALSDWSDERNHRIQEQGEYPDEQWAADEQERKELLDACNQAESALSGYLNERDNPPGDCTCNGVNNPNGCPVCREYLDEKHGDAIPFEGE